MGNHHVLQHKSISNPKIPNFPYHHYLPSTLISPYPLPQYLPNLFDQLNSSLQDPFIPDATHIAFIIITQAYNQEEKY